MREIRIRDNYLNTIEQFFTDQKYRSEIEPRIRKKYQQTYQQFWENLQYFRQNWQIEQIKDEGGHKLVLFPKHRQVVFKLFRYLPEDWELEKQNYELLIKHDHSRSLARTRFHPQGWAVSQRVQPLCSRDRVPRRLRRLFLDESRENFGWLNSRIVAVDFDCIDEDKVIKGG